MSKCAFSVWKVNFFIKKTLMCLSHSKNIFTCFQGNIMWNSLWKLSYSTIVCVWRPGSHFTGFFNKIDFFVKPIQKHITMDWIFLIHANLFPKIVSYFIGWDILAGLQTFSFFQISKQDSGRMTWDLFKL